MFSEPNPKTGDPGPLISSGFAARPAMKVKSCRPELPTRPYWNHRANLIDRKRMPDSS